MEKKKNGTLLFCLFTDILTVSPLDSYSEEYYLNKFFGQILRFLTYSDTIANSVIEAEKGQEVVLTCEKCLITVKRENLFLENEFDKFKEHALSSFCSYYGVHSGQEVLGFFKWGNSSLSSTRLSGYLTVSIPLLTKPDERGLASSNSNKWSVWLRRLTFCLDNPSYGDFIYRCDCSGRCGGLSLLVPIPQPDETFYAFGKDDVLVGFKSRNASLMEVSSVQRNNYTYEITLKNILEEKTNEPITLQIQITKTDHHCNIFRTKEEALNSLTL